MLQEEELALQEAEAVTQGVVGSSAEAAAAANRAAVETERPEQPEAPLSDDPREWGWPSQEERAPEILTLVELEKVYGRLETLNGATHSVRDPSGLQVEADDALQGATVILGMGFSGDVQMLTLAILREYRKIKGLREGE